MTTGKTSHPNGYRGAIEDFYDESAERLARHLTAGRTVVRAVRGRPDVLRLLHVPARPAQRPVPDRGRARVSPRCPPPPPRPATPLVRHEDVLTVLPGTLPTPELARRLADTQGAAIMKLGRTFPARPGGAARRPAGSTTRCTSSGRPPSGQAVLPVVDVDPAAVPYFSIVIVPGETAGRSSRRCRRRAWRPGSGAGRAAGRRARPRAGRAGSPRR